MKAAGDIRLHILQRYTQYNTTYLPDVNAENGCLGKLIWFPSIKSDFHITHLEEIESAAIFELLYRFRDIVMRGNFFIIQDVEVR